ncbi:MAG: hypothetical protein N3D77_09955 [Geminicoccaceae bacterium]|nr:hypothetical protein [Geminicoccaceae bacterium]
MPRASSPRPSSRSPGSTRRTIRSSSTRQCTGRWQLAAYHAASNRLFVTMHKGGKWTHKQAGDEVWVFDVAAKKRVHRLPLDHHSPTIAVSQDEKPLLFALTETAILTSYDATSFEKKAERTGLGISPWLLYVFGE